MVPLQMSELAGVLGGAARQLGSTTPMESSQSLLADAQLGESVRVMKAQIEAARRHELPAVVRANSQVPDRWPT